MKSTGILTGMAVVGLVAALAASQAQENKEKSVAPSATTTPRSGTDSYKKPPAEELKQKLSPMQYICTQEGGTERAFANEYWDNHLPGIYVDVVSGEPLFASVDKFDSGTGWPSFSKPLVLENIKGGAGSPNEMRGKEVRSARADSHLGHVFADGPKPEGLRYCINSAALRFIPLEKLKEEGYGQFLPLFEKAKKKS